VGCSFQSSDDFSHGDGDGGLDGVSANLFDISRPYRLVTEYQTSRRLLRLVGSATFVKYLSLLLFQLIPIANCSLLQRTLAVLDVLPRACRVELADLLELDCLGDPLEGCGTH